MKSIILRAEGFLFLFIYSFSVLFSGGGHIGASEEVTECLTVDGKADAGGVKISSRLLELLFDSEKDDTGLRVSRLMLCPGGSVFGVVIDEVGATVCKTDGKAKLAAGDRIVKVNGVAVSDGSDVENAVKASGGNPILFEVVRGGESVRLRITPSLVDGEYRLGVTLRSQTAGIGTVTFIDPMTLSFGGLGHAVNDSEGNLVTLERGVCSGVVLGGCKRGERSQAGELTGVLTKNRLGSIVSNTPCGVFGKFDAMPTEAEKAIPVASRSEVRIGEAEIISTVRGEKRQHYKIEITEIDLASDGSKSFKIKVTDPALIALTGGIVRGMSGSPIIQNGKLVGAVTHVMVADPTEGYGIFIENMLNASQEARNELPSAA